MAINANLVQKGYSYTSDILGTTLNVRQSAGHAAAASLPAGVSTQANWGKISRRNKPRTVSGVNGAQKAEIVCSTVSDAAGFIAAGTFTLNGVAYTVTGYEGEKLTVNKV